MTVTVRLRRRSSGGEAVRPAAVDHLRRRSAAARRGLGLALGLVLGLLAACGGGAGDTAGADSAAAASPGAEAGAAEGDGAAGVRASALAATAASAPTTLDAVRFAQQATMGPSEALVSQLKSRSLPAWLQEQMTLATSHYTSGGDDSVHKNVGSVGFCDQPAQAGNPNCWRDYFATDPLIWDFYRNATGQPDQLRQRVAMALHQILVISGYEISGTYGIRNYHNALLAGAFGNYRDVLRKVIRSPVMGDYLDHVNNSPTAPNENFARELLQLFALGTCQLEANGKLVGGACLPVYDNDMVRNYAFALTGWTYPAGGSASWGCWPTGANCQYYGGDMVPAPALRNKSERTLLSGITVPKGADAPTALEYVLDSLMAHPNIGPFLSRQLIQQLVSSNPTPAYVSRVSAVFDSGRFKISDGSTSFAFGNKVKGDLAATVAAILLDPEARDTTVNAENGGRLNSPALFFTGALRAMNGFSDGAALGWWWGEQLKQRMFNPPSVFSYYPPRYPVAGTPKLVGPEFGIHNANGALNRLNYLTYLFDWDGSAPDASIPNAIGTRIKVDDFLSSAPDAEALVDRLSRVMLGKALGGSPRQKVIDAVAWWTVQRDSQNWQARRVRTAAYLILASPDYQVAR